MIDQRLMTLLTLVKIKNYTKTAQKLFITQPAVTNHIKTLEKEYGISIFNDSKTFELTSEGKILVEYARRMVNQSTQHQEALDKSKTSTKEFRFALTNESMVILQKRNLMSSFFDYYNCNATLNVDTPNNIFKNLQAGNLDFAVIDCEYDDDMFDGCLLDSFTIVPVCYSQGKFKEIKRVTREMLKNNPLIIGNQEEGMGKSTIQGLKNSSIKISNSSLITCNSSFVMSECIKAKDGIGFMYLDLVYLSPYMKKMDLVHYKASQNIYLIYNSSSYDKKELKNIVDSIKKWTETDND